MRLRGRQISWKDLLKTLYREWDTDNVGDTAAALTFFGVLAIFPFFLFVVSVASLILDPARALELTADLRRVAPPAVATILGERLQALSAGSRPGLLTVGALGAIWATSSGVTALMRALNQAYDVKDSRPWWKVRGIALLTTLVGAVLSIVAAALVLATPAVAHAIGGPIETVILWLRFPIAALVMMLVLALLYYFLPDVEQDFRFITPGSVTGVLIWIAASVGFSLYVQSFGSYEVTYGALGGVVVLLLWMWISSMAVLLGAEINAVIEHLSPEGKRAGAKELEDRGPDAPKSVKRPRSPEAASGERPPGERAG
ncbi:MAG: YihY/virulence factor BrkB family protein [Polyangiaceae bacterium]|nr:YihY/virulence factor BrkB family protein [Polyangiaceae bacterium]